MMFRRRHTTRRQLPLRAKLRRGAIAAACLSLVAVLLVVGSGLITPSPAKPSAMAATLNPTQKLFTPSQHPVLKLTLRPQTTALGSWLVPKAWAATEPTVSVDNEGRKTDVTSQVAQTADGYDITLTPNGFVRPGTYTVTVTGDSAGGAFKTTQSFAWGVLAINTSKATYRPGEAAILQMAALSSKGHTLCSAPLQLSITDPAGNTTSPEYINSDQCKGDGFSSVPDYTASYQTGQPGTYAVALSIKDTEYVIHDSFLVAADQPFDVERSGVTRLYPSSSYGMGFQVTASADYKGVVTETVPSEFTNVKADGADIKTGGERSIITWNVDWKQGSTYSFGYTYQPPHITPAVFALGPLKIGTGFTEARSWQLANDAAITLVKETVRSVSPAATTDTSAVTSTAGNTLILVWSKNAGTGFTVQSITDSAANSWTIPAGVPSQNPPANMFNGVSTASAMSYVANAAAITSVTVNNGGVATLFAYSIIEFSGIDTASPVDQSASAANSVSASHTTPTITLNLCDQPTTDQLLRGGNYFCSPDSELIIGSVMAGSNSPSLNQAGFTALTNLTTGTVNLSPAYKIVSASNSYSINWTVGVARGAAVLIMSFRQQHSASDEHSFFWAK